MWNVRNLKTGADTKLSENGRTYSQLREIFTDIWADTLQEQSADEKEAEFLAYDAQEAERHACLQIIIN